MSLILAGGNKDFLILSGEQRAMGKDGSVISENFRKVYRINEDVMVAFAGKISYCKEILEPIRQFEAEDDLFTNVEISYEIEHMVEKVTDRLKGTMEENTFFGIILCGKTLHGRPKHTERNPFFMHSYVYNGSLMVSRRLLKENNLFWSALYNDNYNHKQFCKEMFRRKLIINVDDAKDVFQQTFDNGAKHDKTVNNQVIYEIMEQ
jgi:20S proteasome alpha/beta subunit